MLTPVEYRSTRITPDLFRMVFHQDYEEEFKRSVLKTKFSHWKYEQEIRHIVRLSDQTFENGRYFSYFSSHLRLREAIVGIESSITREILNQALGDLGNDVTTRKARLAFRTFRVVEQRKKSLWP